MRLAPAMLCFAALAAQAQVRVGEVANEQPAQIGAGPGNGGAEVMSGSAVSASARIASLRLDRGGAVRICPRTTITASASPSGRELMLAVNSGTFELNYGLASNSDSVVTPDMRLNISGPAIVHLAVDVRSSGDVCVASLERNDATVVASELAGEGSFRVRPGESVFFTRGSVEHPRPATMNCGCPVEPAGEVQRAATEAPHSPAPSGEALPASPVPPNGTAVPRQVPAPATDAGISPHIVVELDAPMIYNGRAPEVPGDEVSRLTIFRSANDVLQSQPPALPPPQPPPKAQPVQEPLPAAPASPPRPEQPKPARGFFRRIGGFFASMFRSSGSH
ncbi:MAG: hypothetical protein JO041_09600 [Acidobacteria bacterium]|nr:hypothetical protein [Acidobacteriota bacterium]